MPSLPSYIGQATPNPQSKRAPWYSNTAPSYAGIFLWVVFYQSLAQGTLEHAGPLLCIAGLIVAGLLSYGLYYYVPAMLGMQTGYPLYVVGSSTFGTAGGYLMPGLLMGLLQIGWFAVGTFYSTQFILKGLHVDATPGTLIFIIVAVLWCYSMAYVGVKGIQYVSRVSIALNFIPLFVIIVVFLESARGLPNFKVPSPSPLLGFATLLQAVIGFFATAGAAGADFGMNNRNATDVKWGGLIGIAGAILVAGGLPILAVAGAHGNNANLAYSYDAVVSEVGGLLASAMFLLFAIASIVPACFCAFIAGNSFATMLPGVPRMSSTMIGCTIALVLAITGVAANLGAVFSIVGASFGPICGAMTADYLLAGRRWAGPRVGINWAGYTAWALGFAVGIQSYVQPAVLYSFVTGFVVYIAMAKMGTEPATVSSTSRAAA
jgi:cytosine permease